jgi:hypothetical protein
MEVNPKKSKIASKVQFKFISTSITTFNKSERKI